MILTVPAPMTEAATVTVIWIILGLQTVQMNAGLQSVLKMITAMAQIAEMETVIVIRAMSGSEAM